MIKSTGNGKTNLFAPILQRFLEEAAADGADLTELVERWNAESDGELLFVIDEAHGSPDYDHEACGTLQAAQRAGRDDRVSLRFDWRDSIQRADPAPLESLPAELREQMRQVTMGRPV
jgi:hypothetical protein